MGVCEWECERESEKEAIDSLSLVGISETKLFVLSEESAGRHFSSLQNSNEFNWHCCLKQKVKYSRL